MSEQVEIAIIGAGPAGLAAGVQAAARGASHVLLDRGELANTIFKYQKGKHVMAEPDRLPLQPELQSRMDFRAGTREEILDTWANASKAANVDLRCGAQHEVKAISGAKGDFQLTVPSGTIQANHIVLAIGLQGNLRAFGVPGDDMPHVSYQLDDPADFVGKRIVVVGVGDAGIENAMALLQHDNDVILINRAAEIDRAKAANKMAAEAAIKSKQVGYYTDTMADHFEEGAVVFKTPNGLERLEADLVIGRLGAIPPRRWMEDIGIEFPSKDREAVPEVSESYESNVPGLYLVGALAGYPLIKQCMNQGYEAVEHILGHEVVPADEPLLKETFKDLGSNVTEVLERIRREIPLYASPTNIQLREFLAESTIHLPRPGERIIERNEATDSLYTVLEGEVNVLIPESDADAEVDLPEAKRKMRKIVRGKQHIVGEGSLLSGRRRGATVEAGNGAILIETPRLATIRLMKSVPAVGREVDRIFMARAIETSFPEASSEAVETLSATAVIRTFDPGETLFNQGDDPDGLHLVRRGAVSVSWLRGDRQVVLDYAQAGKLIGEMAFLQPDAKRSATCAASVYTETIFIPDADIRAFLAREPEIRERLQELARGRQASNTFRVQQRAATDLLAFLLGAPGGAQATDLLLVDESLCVRCDNCEKACAETHGGVSRLDREAGPTFGRVHVPTSCRHCEDPKCMTNCPADSIRRHPDGEVYIKDNCIACGNCVADCPYDVIQLATIDQGRRPNLLMRLLFGNSDGGKAKKSKKMAAKCDLCTNLPTRRGGARAACVSSCPTGAIIRVNPAEYVEELMGQ